jgi:hypothetical protein
MKYVLISSLLLIPASVSGLTQETTRSAGRIEYSAADEFEPPHFTVLRATDTASGKTYELIGSSKKMCLDVVDQRDFDGDGFVDALVKHIWGCGGNCCANGFFFVSNLGGGRFQISDEFDDSKGDPVIEEWKSRWSVLVASGLEGIDERRLLEVTGRFILESGKAVQVEEWTRKEMESITEIRSEIFDPNQCDEIHSLEYDLDGDGKKDQIITKYWSRWGRMNWTIEFADGKKFSTGLGCKRIGVLPTKTNGVSDLVCDQDTVFRWNGQEYQEPD